MIQQQQSMVLSRKRLVREWIESGDNPWDNCSKSRYRVFRPT